MNLKTIITLTIIVTLFATITACNRSKGNTAGTSQATTPEADFTFDDGSITAYNGTDTEVVIPSKIGGQEVTYIGYGAFAGHKLTSVSIPPSVTDIRGHVFMGTLTSITIGADVNLGTDEGEYGMQYAFSEDTDFDIYYYRGGCQAGTYTLNNGKWTNEKAEASILATQENERAWTWSETESQVKGDKTWKTGNGVFTATLSKGTLTISGTGDFEKKGEGDYPWKDNPNLKVSRVVIGDGITAIPYYAFDNMHLTSITLPNSVTEISFGAFSGNQLTSITFPENLTYIGSSAFYGNRLTNITIPPSVTRIDKSAFLGNPLTSITIGANLHYEDWEEPFVKPYDAGGRQAGTYTLNNGIWSLQGGQQTSEALFDYFDGTLSNYKGNATTLVIPSEYQGQLVDSISGLQSIGLTSITLPSSVHTIIGEALSGNPLGSITIGADVTFGQPCFDRGFEYTYDAGGKQAGTYVRQNGEWVKQ